MNDILIEPYRITMHKHPFYKKTWFIILMLLFFAPAGIYLMAKYTNWKPKVKRSAGIVAAIIFILFSAGTYNAPPTITLANASATKSVIKTDGSSYTVSGQVSSLRGVKLKINDRDVSINQDQTFKKIVSLKEGDNTITIQATDSKGTDTKYLKIHRATATELAERKRLATEAEATRIRAAAEAEAKRKAEESQKAAAAGKLKLAQQAAQNSELYTVTSIIDGDTIKVSMNGIKVTIRLIGIDTPETSDPRKPVQCYGKEASSRMQHFVQSKQVRLAADSTQGDKDKYDRLLRYVFLEDGRNVAYEMIREGSGKEYTYSSAYQYQTQFKEAGRLASEEKLGLWATNTCSGDTTQPAMVSPAPAPTQPAPVAPVPLVQSPSNCDSNYSPCVPKVSYDLDCPDIGFRVSVIGTDTHRLDRDGDGSGCESY